MTNEIKVPQILMEQRNFCLRINDNNTKMFQHVDYLKQMVTGMHQVYLKLCKHMIQISDQYERKISDSNNKVDHAYVIKNFIKSVNFLHMTINNQLSNNNVTLGTKTHKIAKNRLQILREKLIKCDDLNGSYLQKVNVYNQKSHRFSQKCEYFKDYEKDVLKYYSMKQNSILYEKLATKQMKLKQKLQQIYQLKDEYKVNISEIRVTQKEYFQMQKNIINQYKKLLLNIRKSGSLNNQIYNQPIIEERSDEANSTVVDVPIKSGRSDKQKQTAKTVAQMRKDIGKQFQKCFIVQGLFEQFIDLFQAEVATAGQKIDEIRSAGEYKKFNNDKLVISQILSAESIRDIDLIVNEVSFFRTIILNLSSLFGKKKVMKQLKKYRGLNFDRFIQDTNPLIQAEKNGQTHVKGQYRVHQQKYQSSHNEFMTRFKEMLNQFQNDIIKLYYNEDQGFQEIKNKKVFKNDLFQKKYFQILMNPFFLSKQQNFNFLQNQYLRKYSRQLNANQIQKAVTMTGFNKKNANIKMKMTCCGLVKVEEENDKGPQIIDQFHCALKDGYILIQGKLKLYANYINFGSSFNSKTLFGYSDIRIPKWDIIQFGKDKHLLVTLVVIIETTHGKLQFTSFLNDPTEKLLDLYDNRKSGVSFINKNDYGEAELQVLEQRFQSDFQSQLRKSGLIIDKLSTYLSQDKHKLSISIEYHINCTEDHLFFQIKLIQNETATQYIFIHDQQSKNGQIKTKLQNISKDLINRKQQIKKTANVSKKQDNQASLNFQFSMIQANQKNKFSFLKEPSFMNKKSQSMILDDAFLTNQSLQLGNLLSSRGFLSNAETSRLNQLEQRISAKSDQTPADKIKSQNDSSPIVSMFTSTTPGVHDVHVENTDTITIKSHKSHHNKHSSKVSKHSTASSKSSKGISDYKGVIAIIGVVFILNLVIRLFG